MIETNDVDGQSVWFDIANTLKYVIAGSLTNRWYSFTCVLRPRVNCHSFFCVERRLNGPERLKKTAKPSRMSPIDLEPPLHQTTFATYDNSFWSTVGCMFETLQLKPVLVLVV